MSPMDWLQRLFASKEEGENPEQEVEEERPAFSFNEHMRVVLAIVVVFFSACFLWWLLV